MSKDGEYVRSILGISTLAQDMVNESMFFNRIAEAVEEIPILHNYLKEMSESGFKVGKNIAILDCIFERLRRDYNINNINQLIKFSEEESWNLNKIIRQCDIRMI